ncbi:DUF2169 domain-containing protein [Polyangium sp. 6x1]|uniref:DUF2169 family type VI secretion system accessory protein n=1 Tax=Polyangium sp. 6x1 TaxID=3042689 RepID=UPI002482DBC7|nr:DUF2169 domain-containing protein [Polyangium sp. 6x1]MDI1451373.1 DUF2169 domain-containing protein [Polyangium sp. 6x1]
MASIEVVSACPLRVGSILWQPREGAYVLTVVCKATFALAPEVSLLAEEQDDPNEHDEYWDDDERRSLSAASDLAPFKRGVDILLVGHAYAPHASPSGPFFARLVVGDVLDKTIEVHGERAWTPDGRLLEEPPSGRVALRWERAAGGPGTANPVGVPPNAPPDHRHLRRVPNFGPPGHGPSRPTDVIPPVGFGPIAPTWPDRQNQRPRQATGWDHHRLGEWPLPAGLDASFFNTAPPDQRVTELVGDERISLTNLHPHFPALSTRLRLLKPRALVQKSGAPAELRFRCDTLFLDTNRGICSLTWRGALPLASPSEEGCVVVTTEESDRQLSGSGAPGTVQLDWRSSQQASAFPALPFASGDAADAEAIGLSLEDTTSLPSEPARVDPAAALPFVKAPPPVLGAALPAPPPAPALLPFEPPSPLEETIKLSPGPARVDPAAALPFVKPPLAVLGAALPAPPPPPSRPPVRPPSSVPPPAPALHFEPPPASRPPPPDLVAPGLPAAPPMIGPLATLRDPGSSEILPPPAPPAPVASAPEPEIDPATVSMERFATISAEIAEKRDPRADILRRNELTERSFAAIEHRFSRELTDEASRGEHDERAKYDRAYVAAVEGFRGPIKPEEYARIMASLVKGQANAVLDELKIQRPALMPILRSWAKNAAGDAGGPGGALGALDAFRRTKRA